MYKIINRKNYKVYAELATMQEVILYIQASALTDVIITWITKTKCRG